MSIKTHVLFYAIRPCNGLNGLDTIVSNGRKKTIFRLLLDTALKTVAYLSQVIQIVETLVRHKIRFIVIKEAVEFDGKQDLRTTVMIAAGSYVVFQHQSGRYPEKQEILRVRVVAIAREHRAVARSEVVLRGWAASSPAGDGGGRRGTAGTFRWPRKSSGSSRPYARTIKPSW